MALESYDVGPCFVYFSGISFESPLLVGFLKVNLNSLFLGNPGQLGVGVGIMSLRIYPFFPLSNFLVKLP
jgi:hypothetical protein